MLGCAVTIGTVEAAKPLIVTFATSPPALIASRTGRYEAAIDHKRADFAMVITVERKVRQGRMSLRHAKVAIARWSSITTAGILPSPQ